MSKTNIEELILRMEQLKATKLYQGSFKAIDDCIHLAYAMLEMEKEQMLLALKISPKEAYIAGQKTMYCGCYSLEEASTFEEWVSEQLKSE